jgi:hypothetical protein
MRSVTIFLLAAAALAVPACHKQQQQAEAGNMSIDDDLVNSGMPANADIEALPPDESSGTPTNELAAGDDNPDVNATVNNSD